jgi:predicted DNA-binding WGR domain protein
MPRYELDGEYFWTIEIAGVNVTTSNGRIGNAGHTRIKAAKSEAEARGLYDELVAEKVEQGYALVGAAPAPSSKAAPASKPISKPAAKRKTKR